MTQRLLCPLCPQAKDSEKLLDALDSETRALRARQAALLQQEELLRSHLELVRSAAQTECAVRRELSEVRVRFVVPIACRRSNYVLAGARSGGSNPPVDRPRQPRVDHTRLSCVRPQRRFPCDAECCGSVYP